MDINFIVIPDADICFLIIQLWIVIQTTFSHTFLSFN